MYHIFFIHQSVDGHRHVLATVNSAAMNIGGVHVSFSIMVFSEYMPSSGFTGEGNGTPLQYSCLENPWMEEPGRLQSMGSLRVVHD